MEGKCKETGHKWRGVHIKEKERLILSGRQLAKLSHVIGRVLTYSSLYNDVHNNSATYKGYK